MKRKFAAVIAAAGILLVGCSNDDAQDITDKDKHDIVTSYCDGPDKIWIMLQNSGKKSSVGGIAVIANHKSCNTSGG